VREQLSVNTANPWGTSGYAALGGGLKNWLQQPLTRAHPDVVVVPLAAKLARIVGAVLGCEEDFDEQAVRSIRGATRRRC
jgi:hypothetical protein